MKWAFPCVTSQFQPSASSRASTSSLPTTLRARPPWRRTLVAVPTAPASTCQQLRGQADEVVCATTPRPFRAVGYSYRSFPQTSDEEVRGLVEEAHAAVDGVELALLAMPADGRLLACAHVARDGDAGYFGMFSVEPGLQGAGIGSRLLAECERIAAGEWQLPRMRMTVIDVRDALIAYYERRGYRRTGIRKPFPYGDARFGIPLRDDLALGSDLRDDGHLVIDFGDSGTQVFHVGDGSVAVRPRAVAPRMSAPPEAFARALPATRAAATTTATVSADRCVPARITCTATSPRSTTRSRCSSRGGQRSRSIRPTVRRSSSIRPGTQTPTES